MSLIEQINTDYKTAMLAHDETKKVTLGGLKSAFLYKKVDLGNKDDLTEAQMLDVIAAQVKQRDDSIAVYHQAGDTEREAEEQAQRDILAQYLPKPLTKVVSDVVSENGFTQKEFGKVVAAVKAKVGHSATGGDIAAAIKKEFSK